MTNFVLFLLFLSIFCISFDIFLTINVAGFNLRFSQILFAVLLIYVLLIVVKKNKIVVPLGFLPLIIWMVFQIIFLPNTTFIERSIGYILWMIFNLFMIFTVVNLLTSEDRLKSTMRCYIRSFFAVGLFGIIQFISPVIGIGKPLIVQWWIKDLVPRVNGFSYEPSYYATYMLIGWIVSFYLLWYKSELFSSRETKLIFFTCTFAMILSSSRMGILVMGMFIGWQIIKKILTGKINKWLMRVVIIGIAFCIVLSPFIIEKAEIFLNGTGLRGTSSHSISERSEKLIDTLQVFMDSPLRGVSLGGVSSAIAKQYEVVVTNQSDAKSFEGMNVFAEVLAASGLIGVIPFIIFLLSIYMNVKRIASMVNFREYKIWLLGLLEAFIFLLIILQFNQNILRPYLWLHISMICAVYFIVNTKFIKSRNERYMLPR